MNSPTDVPSAQTIPRSKMRLCSPTGLAAACGAERAGELVVPLILLPSDSQPTTSVTEAR